MREAWRRLGRTRLGRLMRSYAMVLLRVAIGAALLMLTHTLVGLLLLALIPVRRRARYTS